MYPGLVGGPRSGGSGALLVCGLAPRSPLRTARCAADVRMGEAFAYQDVAGVPSAYQQRSTQATIIAIDHHLHLLRLACDALDRAEQARQALATLGTLYLDRFNAPHRPPEVAIERDSRIAFARLCWELDLDTDMAAAARHFHLHQERRASLLADAEPPVRRKAVDAALDIEQDVDAFVRV